MSDRPAAAWPNTVTGAFAFGLVAVAAVPGFGYFYGQFVETIVLCIGGAALAYAALVAITAMNSRIGELERRLGDRAK
jgi:hypothetical protein